jgi:hypothetical protein
MIFGRLSLLLKVMLGSRCALLAAVADFLIAIDIAGYYNDVIGSLLLPLLAALSAFPGAYDSGLSGYGPATVGGHSRVA